MPGDIVFAAGALLMAWDFLVKLHPLFSRAPVRPARSIGGRLPQPSGETP